MDDDRSADNDRLSVKLVTFHHLPVANLLPVSGPGGGLKIETSVAEPSLTLGLPCSDNAGYAAAAFSYSDPHESTVSSLDAGARKKLRLTKEQSAVLEDKFKEHATLNQEQKQALAKELKLRPRQVEVWFQNRRARTKLKKSEAELEFLRKWCETLKEENRRLHAELKELKSRQQPVPMCPACKKVDRNAGGGHVGAAKPQLQYLFLEL
ncbi:homeobox-leucine zipper protein HOX11-like [Zingiber officinale]|uniref:homeobox-leucine zipper protein HOX11-like n=1 Tax=Zingiber officinale TaxID=94328 RepID=UPI001C4C5050|nr:homeobox-leucine zipper protein HOX11-like [Zingiber officinale]